MYVHVRRTSAVKARYEIFYSYEEAGRYLETYKAFENKPPDMLMEKIDSDFSSRVSHSIRSLSWADMSVQALANVNGTTVCVLTIVHWYYKPHKAMLQTKEN